MIGDVSNTKLQGYNAKCLMFLAIWLVIFAPVFMSYATACCVTDVDLYVREMPEDPWGEWVGQCSGTTVYFRAECQVDADPDECRPIHWQFIWNDGYVTDLYTYSVSSGPCSGGTFSKTTSHTYYHGSNWEPSVTAERQGAGCLSVQDTCRVTIVEVAITEAPGYVLVYTGSEAGNQPTKTATATGTPSGGAYSWTREQTGSGYIEFVGGTTSSTVTIRGTAPSSDPPKDDVDLIVEYTYGISCETSVSLRVRRMSSTTCHWGELNEGRLKTSRFFYHTIKDQFTNVINETGIPCDEHLRWKEGAPLPDEWSAPTLDHSSDGNWYGGIAVKDFVSYPNRAPVTNHGQDIDAGKWSTSPSYDIWIDISDKTTHMVWKNIEQ